MTEFSNAETSSSLSCMDAPNWPTLSRLLRRNVIPVQIPQFRTAPDAFLENRVHENRLKPFFFFY